IRHGPPAFGGLWVRNFSEDLDSLDDTDELRYEEITFDPPGPETGRIRPAEKGTELPNVQDLRETAVARQVRRRLAPRRREMRGRAKVGEGPHRYHEGTQVAPSPSRFL